MEEDKQRQHDLLLASALARTLGDLAEKIDGDFADEATVAELRELQERGEAILLEGRRHGR
ncbi:MAG: hypothetical protein JO073_08435 [Actinobacteria bacterium]|nr:hypothetical protein [Actinomycetota bacterium]